MFLIVPQKRRRGGGKIGLDTAENELFDVSQNEGVLKGSVTGHRDVAVEEVEEAVDVRMVGAAVEQAVGGAEAEVGEEEDEVTGRPWCGGKMQFA